MILLKNVCNTKIKNVEDKIPELTNSPTIASLNAKINKLKGEIPNITNLATNDSLNSKINEIKGEISNVTNLPITIVLTAIESKIPNFSNLVKKN